MSIEKIEQLEPIEITADTWNEIKPKVFRQSNSAQQYFTEEEIIKAVNSGYVNTLNNKPVTMQRGITPVEVRLKTNNRVLKLPDGIHYAVISKTAMQGVNISDLRPARQMKTSSLKVPEGL